MPGRFILLLFVLVGGACPIPPVCLLRTINYPVQFQVLLLVPLASECLNQMMQEITHLAGILRGEEKELAA